MISPAEPKATRVSGFRTKLLAAIMLVVATVTLLALILAQRGLAANVERDLEREFESELAGLRRTRDLRHAALVERSRALPRRPRIRGAFEDDALDLLYLNAEDELRDVMARSDDVAAPGLRAEFYRFLSPQGAVIPGGNPRAVGALTSAEEGRLALPRIPDKLQLGYLVRGERDLAEIMTMPIFSSETAEVIAGLVLGFKPIEPGRDRSELEMKSGIWAENRLHAPGMTAASVTAVAPEVSRSVARLQQGSAGQAARVAIGEIPHLMFVRLLNRGSLYPAAYEVCVYPLSGLIARQRQLRWQVLGAGGALMLVGLIGSHFVAGRLSAPVEQLAVDSEEQRTQRARAEAALELTSAELQRSARFSADASHQLKTPVTVLRAGLEELLSRENLAPEECHEISALIHQTYRLSTLIEDLLLLSRLDAGRMKLEFTTVNLSDIIEASLDDLSALPDELHIAAETEFPRGLHILGEKRYTAIILQNLLENARKYNRPSGRIRIHAHASGDTVRLAVGNTGRPISPTARAHIFERFHRGSMGENVPGYGLGLNLARELARLHQGDLLLTRTDEDWTEFEVHFRVASPVVEGHAAT